MDNIILPSRSRNGEEFLTPASPTTEPSLKPSLVQPVSTTEEVSSAEDVLSVLKAKPDAQQLSRCLLFLSQEDEHAGKINVKLPGPLAAQIVFVLVSDIVPAYWQQLVGDTAQRKLLKQLVRSLRSLAGLGAILNRLQALSRDFHPGQAEKAGAETHNAEVAEELTLFLQLLESVLHGNNFVAGIVADVSRFEAQKSKRSIYLEGLVTLLAGSSVLTIAAKSDMKRKERSNRIVEDVWVSDGSRYSKWLGSNILEASLKIGAEDTEKREFRDRFLNKAIRMAYTTQLLGAIYSSLLKGDTKNLLICRDLLHSAPCFMKSSILNTILRLMADGFRSDSEAEAFVRGNAALLHALTDGQNALLDRLSEWLTGVGGAIIGLNTSMFRTVIAVISQDLSALKEAYDNSLGLFGSKHFIQHNPVLQQEAQCKILLLLTGALFRLDPQFIRQSKSSSLYLGTISNRIGASLSRLQFLGMTFGMAVSDLCDKEEDKLKFPIDDSQKEENHELRQLVYVHDQLGVIADLALLSADSVVQALPNKLPVTSEPKKAAVTQIPQRIVAIEELSEGESEDDLPVYAKPDSDPEDEEDDPTLINRNKATAPVYIRDLLAGLRDSENYDRHKLAIKTAAPLIRRKTSFGTEVKDHLEELATQLAGLKDTHDLEDFQKHRLQALIAVIVASPLQMSQWFCNTYFNGDYSMAQRAAILSALALAARELAGYKNEDSDMTGANEAPDFPSKRLPERLEKLWQLDAAPVKKLSGKLEREILQPMALQAADKATGPNVLKVRTFSSRMEVQKRRRIITNELAKVVADGFLFPLTGRWRAVVRARGEAGSAFASPFLLSHFVRTLGLIVGASGASTLSLPAMTVELWNLLLDLRRPALADQTVLEAVLFALLTLLEINSGDQRRLAEEHAQELMDTKAWAEGVLENLRGGSPAEDKIKVLASGVLVKIQDIVEQYQRVILGNLVLPR